MSPRCYATEHQHSRVIMHAFAQGCKGQIVPPLRLYDGPAAMYGILRGTGEIVKQCEWVGRDYYYIDHGYFKPGHYEGYYRITRNGRQASINSEERKADRFNGLGVSIKPWRKRGRNVLVIPLTGAIAAFHGINPKQWLDTVCEEVSKHTDRPIIVKPKDEGTIRNALVDCWCLVTDSSNTAVDALIEGVPVVALGESVCKPVSWKLEHIEKPWWPEREIWARAVAWHQFTLSEMRDGTAWNVLQGADK